MFIQMKNVYQNRKTSKRVVRVDEIRSKYRTNEMCALDVRYGADVDLIEIWKESKWTNERNNNNEKTNIIQRPWQLRPLQFVATKIARLNFMRVERKVFCAMMMTHEARRNLKRELIIFWTLFACLLTYYHIIKFGANFRERGSERTRDSFEFDSILMRLCAQKISYTWAVLDISVVIGCVVLLLPSFRMFVVFFFS